MSEAGRSESATFLFTDIEGSTRLLDRLGEAYDDVFAEHCQLLRDAFAGEAGREVGTSGDSFFVIFDRPAGAVAAAAAAQRAISEHDWPDGVELRVRMGIHSGEARRSGEGYVGLDVHRAARIADAAHGGQILLSEATRALVPHTRVRALGEHRLKDLPEPQALYQLVVEGAPDRVPAAALARRSRAGASRAVDAARRPRRARWPRSASCSPPRRSAASP